jgi:ATP:ADP antiporter, AAA family
MKSSSSLRFKRIATLYTLGFLLIFGYALARPCIDSLFLEHFSSNSLPSAWLLTAIFSAFVIAIYNRYNQHYAIFSMYGATSIICAIFLFVLLLGYHLGLVWAIYLLYIWKEIYMVVLMEMYWSYADIVFNTQTARWTYGLAMAVGSLGGVLGNLIIGPFARLVGTEKALWCLIFFLLAGYVVVRLAKKVGDQTPNEKQKKTANIQLGLKTLLNSRYLVPLALLVCLVQVVIGLIDYNFNTMLRESATDTDTRTGLIGQIHAAVNVIAIVLQISTGPILRLIGIGSTFLSIPIVLSGLMFGLVLFHSFPLMMAVKTASKALDYSLFRAIKEILYIPLSREEKTQGKGFIDIFIYRLARGLASLMLLGLIAIGFSHIVMEIAIVLMALWLILALILAKRYSKATAE